MRKSIQNPLFAITCFAAFGILQLSCDNDNAGTQEIICSAAISPDILRFNLIDKNTKEDLFLPENPAYDLAELQLFMKKPIGDDLQAMEHYLSDDEGHIYTYVSAGSKINSIFLQIGEQPLDTIVYTIKMEKELGCPFYILDRVTFNHETPEKNAHGRIIPFYRKK